MCNFVLKNYFSLSLSLSFCDPRELISVNKDMKRNRNVQLTSQPAANDTQIAFYYIRSINFSTDVADISFYSTCSSFHGVCPYTRWKILGTLNSRNFAGGKKNTYREF